MKSVGSALGGLTYLVFSFTPVCPANWNPGDATMVADPQRSKEYFAKAAASSGESSGIVAPITSKAEFESTLSAGKAVVVDYWAPWCRNCKKVDPLVQRLANDLAQKASFAKVDTTVLEDVAAEQGVEALPSLHVFKNGVRVASYTGSDPTALENFVRTNLA